MIPMGSEVWELGIAAPGKKKGLGRTTRLDCQMKVDPKVSHLLKPIILPTITLMCLNSI